MARRGSDGGRNDGRRDGEYTGVEDNWVVVDSRYKTSGEMETIEDPKKIVARSCP